MMWITFSEPEFPSLWESEQSLKCGKQAAFAGCCKSSDTYPVAANSGVNNNSMENVSIVPGVHVCF